jgi:hypothetical protein
MHRYNTRFQARNPVQVPKEQVPKEQVPVSNEQVQVQDSQFTKDIRALQVLLDRQCMGINRVKNAIDVFAFLAVNTALLHHPRFRQVVVQKIEEFRPEIEKRKTDAIATFVSTYSPFNTCMQQNELLAARNALYYIPLLAAELNKVDAIIRQ